jgi:hypothetical protein
LRAALAAWNETDSETNAQLARTGRAICAARQRGTPRSLMEPHKGKNLRVIIRLAEGNICPQYLPRVLIRFSGTGSASSRPFIAPASVTAHYSYNCPASGTGDFIANLKSGSRPQPRSGAQPIAHDLNPRGSKTTTVHPQNVGTAYHLAVHSQCSWRIVLRTG